MVPAIFRHSDVTAHHINEQITFIDKDNRFVHLTHEKSPPPG